MVLDDSRHSPAINITRNPSAKPVTTSDAYLGLQRDYARLKLCQVLLKHSTTCWHFFTLIRIQTRFGAQRASTFIPTA